MTAIKVKAQVQVFTTENGLPSNGIKGIAWDEETKFLWLATESGIVRFNGEDFRIYQKENTPEISSERMQFITRNNQGNIFIVDQGGNIFKIEKNQPKLYAKGNLALNPTLNNYFNLGIGEEMYKSKLKQNKTINVSLVSNKLISISDTNCYILINKNLYYYGKETNDMESINTNTIEIENLFKIDNNIFFNDDKTNFYKYNKEDKKINPIEIKTTSGLPNIPKNGNTNIFFENGMQFPILVSNNYAYYITFQNNQLIANLISDQVPKNNYIRSIQFSKKSGLLFIASDSKGLIVLAKNNVTSKKPKEHSTNKRNTYYSQIELNNDAVLTNEGTIINSKEKETYSLPINGSFGYNLSYTQDSLMWYYKQNPVSKINTFFKFNKTNLHTTAYPKIKTQSIVAFLNNKNYFANPKGIGFLDDDSIKYVYEYPTAVNNLVSSFVAISNYEIAIAACSGFSIFNTTTNTLKTFYTKEFICVRSIWAYNEYVFFGTYGDGFYLYKNGSIKKMPLDKMGYLKYAHCFVPDEDGFCWISTNRGLFKANIKDLINAYEKNMPNIYYHYFGKKDGMETTELNGGCSICAITLANKTISFPSMDGLLWVTPKLITPLMPNGELFIDEIKINNAKINLDSGNNYIFPSTTKQIEFFLGVSAWCNKENIYIEYKLKDNDNWIPLNFENEIVLRLNNLAAGNYTLQLRKQNGFGADNFAYKNIYLKIIKAWYKRWWFYALCILGLINATFFLLKLRTKHFEINQKKLETQIEEKTKELLEKNEVLEKNNTIKTRLISIISHDIVTPLKFLNVAGKNLAKNKHLMSEALQQETINEITDTSKELQLLSTNILNWIKYQNENRRVNKETFNAFEMANEVKGILKSLAAQKKLEIINKLDPQLKIHQYYEPLKILLYNLITNAIQFSENAEIIISNYTLNNSIVLQVQDFGTGMTTNQIENILANETIITQSNINSKKGHGLGYLIIKDLIKMTDGALQIESTIGTGTIIKISFPLYY